MRSHARSSLVALLTGVLISLGAAADAQAAEAPGIEKLAAVNCSEGHEQCAHKVVEVELGFPFGKQKYSVTEEPKEAEARAEGFVKAGGHVPFGVTDFTIAHTGALPLEKPTSVVQHIRTDVAPGLATSPVAIPYCSAEQYGVEELPESELFTAPTCPEGGANETRIGVQQATVFLVTEPKKEEGVDLALEGPVFNLEPPKGRASLYGVSVPLPIAVTKGKLEKAFAEHPLPGTEPEKKLTEEALEAKQWYSHSLIEGNVEWGKEAKGTEAGDYHDYFEIKVSPALPLVASRLVFYGTRGGHFVTNATSCPGHLTTRLAIEDLEKTPPVTRSYTTPIPLAECENVPFEPGFLVTPESTKQDTPDGFTAEASLVRHNGAGEIDASQLKTGTFTLPEGMTLNPAAAAGLTACTPAQARIHSPEPGVGCASSSELGTFELEVPTLPGISLSGKIYLGGPEGGGPITSTQPITMYVDAESARYGISVRLRAEVFPNEATGQLTTIFPENPEQPFTRAIFHFKQGALAPVANPLACGTVSAATNFVPYSGQANKTPASNPFTFDLNGAGGACASPLPFAPTQKTSNQSSVPAGHTSFAFTLERSDGQQYFSQVNATLPEGLVGLIPTATQCSESAANSETEECPSNSRLGTAIVTAGAGPTPYTFSGPVYLTGPYAGAPFGMSIKVPAVAGPFNLGTDVVRTTINVNPMTARVTVGNVIPRVYKGVALHLKRITINVEKQGFLINPTSCGVLATESSVTGFVPGSTQSSTVALSSPFQVSNCSSLAFKPAFKAATSAKTSRANGASLETTINQPAGEANIKSVLVQLPPQLPSRLTTLNKACLEAVFAANPYHCGPSVGGVRANTPTLPSKMTGPVYFVSHGGEQFPDLDLVLNANGVRVIVVGNTKITKGITTTHFAAPPDAPVSSITVNLPIGPLSALAAYGNFCTTPLYMPTTIEGQNGKIVKQTTNIKVNGCGVQIVGKKVIGRTAYLTVKTFAAGRISGSGSGVATTARYLGGAVNAASLKVRLTRGGHIKIRVGFLPKNRKLSTSTAYTTVVAR